MRHSGQSHGQSNPVADFAAMPAAGLIQRGASGCALFGASRLLRHRCPWRCWCLAACGLAQAFEVAAADGASGDGGFDFPGVFFGSGEFAHPAAHGHDAFCGAFDGTDRALLGGARTALDQAGVAVGGWGVQVGAQHGIQGLNVLGERRATAVGGGCIGACRAAARTAGMSALTRFRSPRGEVMALPTSVAVWLPDEVEGAGGVLVPVAEVSGVAAGACWAGADAQPPRISAADKVQGMTAKRKTEEFMKAGPREVPHAL